MAREVVTNVYLWCDLCLNPEGDAEPDKVAGEETPPISISNRKPRRLTLCDRHRKEVYEPFERALTEHGQFDDGSPAPVTKARKPAISLPGGGVEPAEGDILCPDPDCDRHEKGFANYTSLSSHAKRTHNMSSTALRASLGEPPPEPTVKRAECPECKAAGESTVYEWPEHGRPSQALGVHRKRKHGVEGSGKQ
jgi:hypothetical protein